MAAAYPMPLSGGVETATDAQASRRLPGSYHAARLPPPPPQRMHYRHLFHAGNFADVFKHVLLVGLLQGLSRKDKPWCCLDTHAGAGGYNLASLDATRTGEWRQGIGRLAGTDTSALPPMLKTYLELVAMPSPGATPGPVLPYPGSPQIALRMARPGDRVVCCEQVPDIAAQLRAHAPGAVVHVRDGYEAHSLLPPAEKRGLILVDPPFEARNELDLALRFLQSARQRFANGVYAVWYPVKNLHEVQRFVRRAAREASDSEAMVCQLDVGRLGSGQMHHCGLLVLNPPYGFATEAETALHWLLPRLSQGPQPACSVSPAG